MSAQVDVAPEAVAGEVAPVITANGSAWSVPWVQLAILLVLIALAAWIGLRRASRVAPAVVSNVEPAEADASAR